MYMYVQVTVELKDDNYVVDKIQLHLYCNYMYMYIHQNLVNNLHFNYM